MKVDIGKSLKEHRESRDFNLTQLAKATGISRQNLSRWETNEVTPNVLACITIATFYGITLDELLSLHE